MSDVKWLSVNSPFVNLFGDLPIPLLLTYIHDSWNAYADAYKNAAPPLQRRSETQLTKALAAYLRERQDAGDQLFPGDFFGELPSYILDNSSGLPKCIARTDIEWRLHGVPGLIVEFKILDGKKPRRDLYLVDGVMRFVLGQYGGSSSVGAMFALLRKSASKDPALLLSEMEHNAAALQCVSVEKVSQIVPKIATFDTSHSRNSPHITPFQLAHLFVSLPE